MSKEEILRILNSHAKFIDDGVSSVAAIRQGHFPRVADEIAAASLAGDGWVSVEPDFLEYVRNAKDEFITKFNNEERSVYLKVAVEDLIIAYDQMKDKLKAKG